MYELLTSTCTENIALYVTTSCALQVASMLAEKDSVGRQLELKLRTACNQKERAEASSSYLHCHYCLETIASPPLHTGSSCQRPRFCVYSELHHQLEFMHRMT
jgi:hypothetical protein